MTDERRRMIPLEAGEPRIRDLLLAFGSQLGELRASMQHGRDESGRINDKLDILNDKFDHLALKVEGGVGDGKLQDKVIGDLVRIVGGEDGGLVKRVDDLEKYQAKARNVTLGVAVGAGIGGTGLGATLYAAGKKLGLW